MSGEAAVYEIGNAIIQRKNTRIKELEEAIRKAAKEFQDMRWGYDGDCGSGFIIDELEEALKGAK